MGALSSKTDVEAIADGLSRLAEQALKSTVAGIKAGRINESQAQEALALIQRIDHAASDLNTYAVKSIVANLSVTQQALKGLVDKATKTIKTIDAARKFIDILADVLVFVAACMSGTPATIIPAAIALGKDMDITVPGTS